MFSWIRFFDFSLIPFLAYSNAGTSGRLLVHGHRVACRATGKESEKGTGTDQKYPSFQFVMRLLILLMPAKHQPDYPWLRLVRLKRVNLFTIIQLISLVFLMIVEEIKTISMVFPLMVSNVLTFL